MQVCEDLVSLGNIILPYTNDTKLSGTLTFNNLTELKNISDKYYNICSFLQPSIYDLNLFSPGIASQIISFSGKNLETANGRNWLWGINSKNSPKFSVSGLTSVTKRGCFIKLL